MAGRLQILCRMQPHDGSEPCLSGRDTVTCKADEELHFGEPAPSAYGRLLVIQLHSCMQAVIVCGDPMNKIAELVSMKQCCKRLCETLTCW